MKITTVVALVLAIVSGQVLAANILMIVGQSYTYDLNSTVPPIPATAVVTVTASNPATVQITKNVDNTGIVKAIGVAGGGQTITYAVYGYTSVTDNLIVSAPPPPPPVVVIRGTVGP